MSLKGSWGTYVHIPKCGGFGLRKFLQANLGPGYEDGPYHGLPLTIERGFTLVRHPVSWLRSFWAYRNNDQWRINPSMVNYWPVIVGLTQWAAGYSWNEFIDALVEHQIDIVSQVYGCYRHPDVKVYKLERITELLDDLGINKPLPMVHVTQNKPAVTPAQREKLEYVCHRSMKDYGYDTN